MTSKRTNYANCSFTIDFDDDDALFHDYFLFSWLRLLNFDEHTLSAKNEPFMNVCMTNLSFYKKEAPV